MDNVAHDGRSSVPHSPGYAMSRTTSQRSMFWGADHHQQQEKEIAVDSVRSINFIPFLPHPRSAPSLRIDDTHQKQQRHGNRRSSPPSYPSSPTTKLRKKYANERTSLLRTTSSPSPLPSPSSKTGTSKYRSDRYVLRRKSLNPPRLETTANAPANFSRRKAPISHAIRYIMEVLCNDLVACGECYVPDDKDGQTLIRYCGFVPIEVDEAVDYELSRFMQGDPVDLAYRRGVGLPGKAWASSRVKMVELLSLTNDRHFDAGGKRLRHAARLFKSALTVPVFSTDGVHFLGGRQLMGVVLVYFPIEWNEEKPLIAYAKAVAASASAISELMVRRAVFVDDRAKRVKRNWRVMKIALRFIIPMIMRYKALTGRNVLQDMDVDHMEAARARTTVVTSPCSPMPTAFRTARYKLAIDIKERSPWAVSPGVPAVLNSREGAKRVSLSEANTLEYLCKWLMQYAAKARGGPVHMPEPNNPRDSFVTWAGVFLSLSFVQLVLAILNDNVRVHDQGNLFSMSGSFGALCTLLFAMPSTPLGQPRIILASHSLAMCLSMMTIFMSTPGKMVWLQQSATVASTILGMCLMGIVHPPAGALVLVFLGAFNQGASLGKVYIMIVSVYIGLAVHILVSILVNNFSPRRGYPVFW